TITLNRQDVNDPPQGSALVRPTIAEYQSTGTQTSYVFSATDFGFSDPLDQNDTNPANRTFGGIRITSLPPVGSGKLTISGADVVLGVNNTISAGNIGN